MSGASVLIARAAVARDTLPVELGKRGARVEVVEAYRTVAPVGLAGKVAAVMARQPDWITFTSSSTVTNFFGAGVGISEDVKVASIGPITSATLRKFGVGPTVEAAEYTVDGIIAAICKT
jgi:uroporphyrinogen-III synthase